MEEDDIKSLYQVEISSETIFRAFERDTDKQDDALKKKNIANPVPGCFSCHGCTKEFGK